MIVCAKKQDSQGLRKEIMVACGQENGQLRWPTNVTRLEGSTTAGGKLQVAGRKSQVFAILRDPKWTDSLCNWED